MYVGVGLSRVYEVD